MKLGNPDQRADVFTVLGNDSLQSFNVASILLLRLGQPREALTKLAVVIDVNSGQLVQLNCDRLQTFFDRHGPMIHVAHATDP